MKRFLLAFGAIIAMIAIFVAILINIPLAKAPNDSLSQDIIIKDVNIVDVENGFYGGKWWKYWGGVWIKMGYILKMF